LGKGSIDEVMIQLTELILVVI